MHATTTLTGQETDPSDIGFPPTATGFWPTEIDALLVADQSGVIRVTPEGRAEQIEVGDVAVAVDDGRGGRLYATVSGPFLGRYRSTVMWSPDVGNPVRLAEPDDFTLVSPAVLTGRHPGPLFALVVGPDDDATGDRCVTALPLAGAQTGAMGSPDEVVCPASGRLLGAGWSGRLLVMAVGSGERSWLEFTDGDGQSLDLIHNPQPKQGAVGRVGHPSLPAGSDQIVYTWAAPEADATELVVVDLVDGVESLRVPVARGGVVVTRVDTVAGAAVVSRVSRSGVPATPLPALLVDLHSGTVGLAPLSGTATIVSTTRPEPPRLFPPRSAPAAPDLVITAPEPFARVTGDTVHFEGRTEPGARVVAAGSYGADVHADGSWAITLALQPGGNRASFTAVDGDGLRTTTHAYVFREMEPGPDRWVGLLHRMGGSPDDYHRIFDVWSSPESPLDVWGDVVAWHETATGTYEVLLVADRPDIYGLGATHDLWVTRRLYRHPADTWVVLDVLDLDRVFGGIRGCHLAGSDEPAFASQVKDTGEAVGPAWRIDFDAHRFVAIDAALVQCHLEAC